MQASVAAAWSIDHGGELRIYDANTSALQSQQLDIIGHAEQVVLVDP